MDYPAPKAHTKDGWCRCMVEESYSHKHGNSNTHHTDGIQQLQHDTYTIHWQQQGFTHLFCDSVEFVHPC